MTCPYMVAGNPQQNDSGRTPRGKLDEIGRSRGSLPVRFAARSLSILSNRDLWVELIMVPRLRWRRSGWLELVLDLWSLGLYSLVSPPR